MNGYRSAALLGVATGLRSQIPLALLARDGDRPLPGPFGRPSARRLFALGALGELVADKLPQTPSRLDPGPLAGRMVFGALAGAVVARRTGLSLVPAVLLGAAGAGAGSYAGFHARMAAGRAISLPDQVLAVAEDALALGLARAALPA